MEVLEEKVRSYNDLIGLKGFFHIENYICNSQLLRQMKFNNYINNMKVLLLLHGRNYF